MRVLVVEDHEGLADAVAGGLRREGMAVDVALDGATALERTAVTDYDVIVLDRDLPDVHGDEVCRSLVATRAPSRILMLTASGTIAERVEGLGIGADDYLAEAVRLRRARRPSQSARATRRAGTAADP